MSISRRRFLQGSAVATAALGVSTASATELFSPVQRIPHASHFGAFYADVQDGKIVNIMKKLGCKKYTSKNIIIWVSRRSIKGCSLG